MTQVRCSSLLVLCQGRPGLHDTGALMLRWQLPAVVAPAAADVPVQAEVAAQQQSTLRLRLASTVAGPNEVPAGLPATWRCHLAFLLTTLSCVYSPLLLPLPADGFLGTVYLDLYKRPHKFPSAAHFTLRCGRRLADGSYQVCGQAGREGRKWAGCGWRMPSSGKCRRCLLC